MLLIIAWVVLFVILGVITLTSFMTIRERIKQKRTVDSMVNYWSKQAELQRNYNNAMYKAINSNRENIKL